MAACAGRQPVRRRELIFASGAAALAWSDVALGDQKPRRIALVSAGQPRSAPPNRAFESRIGGLGYVDGANLELIFRNAEGRAERFAPIAAEIVAARPEAIVAVGPEANLRAMHEATASIPVVMVALDYDPLALGYVTSLARPGGNITGVFAQQLELAAKRLELLMEAVPAATRVGVLWDEFSADQFHAVEREAPRFGVALDGLEFKTPPYDFTPTLAPLRDRGISAVLALMSPVFYRQRVALAESLLDVRLPASFGLRDWVEAGGLMSYGVSLIGMMRRAAELVDKILKGAKPADLPIEQPTKFDLVVNLKTAKALGVTVPNAILARADEVIE